MLHLAFYMILHKNLTFQISHHDISVRRNQLGLYIPRGVIKWSITRGLQELKWDPLKYVGITLHCNEGQVDKKERKNK